MLDSPSCPGPGELGAQHETGATEVFESFCKEMQHGGPGSVAAPAAGVPHPTLPPLGVSKALRFSEPKLEASFEAHLATNGREGELWQLALRSLLWLLAGAKLASANARLPALELALACLLPALAQGCLLLQSHQRPRTILAASLQALSDIGGFIAMHQCNSSAHIGMGTDSRLPLWHMLEFSSQAAAFLAITTLRSTAPFLVRFGMSTITLTVQLLAARSMWVSSPALVTAMWTQLLCVAALGAAYSLPLCSLYWREFGQRKAFAEAQGRRVSAPYVDSWAPLSFIIPGLAQAIALWSHLG